MTVTAQPHVGFIGLGKMGVPICRHISAAPFQVKAFVRNAAGREKAKSIGVETAETLAAVAGQSDIIVSAVTDDEALRAIVSSPDGLANHMRKGSTYIDTSTVSPQASGEVAVLLAERGIQYLRSPISGSTATAEARQLTVLASGPRPVFEEALPVLEAFSAKQFHVGHAEEARYLKLVLNALVGATSALLAEAMAIGRQGGLDPATMLDVVNASAVASPLIRYKTQMIVSGDYKPAFPVSGMMKDFDIALSVARQHHVPLPLLSQIRQTYESSFAEGLGEKDFFVLVAQHERHIQKTTSVKPAA